MIQFEARYVNNAYHISDGKLASTVATLYDGQWLMLNANGEYVIHDGSLHKKGFISLSSKYGDPVANINRPITAAPAGRDNVTSSGMVSVLAGAFRLATDQYEAGSYANGAPLKISANGKLMPCTFVAAPTTVAEVHANAIEEAKVVAYVYRAPASETDSITIIHE